MRLSICVPTHDGRAGVLERLLGTIEAELTPAVRPRVQVCVSDNGSRDATSSVLERFRHRLPLVANRFEDNAGFTRNLLKVMEIAAGDYCWLIGSDDLIAPGGVAHVLEVLDAHPYTAGVTLNRYRVNVFDPDRRELDPPAELPEDADRLRVFSTAEAIFANLGLSHDYISTQVIDRRLFGEVAAEATSEELEASGHFAHLFLLGRMVQRRPTWLWDPEPLVQHTTGTSALDEDLDHDYGAYQLTIMEGRDAVWSMLFGKGSPTYRAVMRRAWLRTAQPLALVGLKLPANHTAAGDLRLLVGMTRHFAWLPEFWLRSFPVLLASHGLLKAISRTLQAARCRPRLLRLLRRLPGAVPDGQRVRLRRARAGR